MYSNHFTTVFLEVELDNLFYRFTSEFESYEYDHWSGNKKKGNCSDIPVYSFRSKNSFNKISESKFKKAITGQSICA